MVRDEFRIVLDELPVTAAPSEGGRLRLRVDGLANGFADVTYAPAGTNAMDRFVRLGFQNSTPGESLDASSMFGIPLGEARISTNVLPAGDYVVRVECDGHAPNTFEIEVRPGETSDAHVQLR